MTNIIVGEAVDDFTAKITGDAEISLSGLKGKNIIIYFYPKDSTPGCTSEGKDFRDQYADFQATDTEVFGVSKDSLASHEKFKTKYNFPFDLITDTDSQLCDLFNVISDKNMYGRIFKGIQRSTFLINKNGVLQREWRKVKVKGHVAEVLSAVKDLNNHP